MLMIFLLMTSMIVGFFYLIIMDVKSGLKIDFSIWITKAEDFPFQKLEVYSCWILQLPFVVACLVIIELKGNKYCLQGIAKLDYLFKVSIF